MLKIKFINQSKRFRLYKTLKRITVIMIELKKWLVAPVKMMRSKYTRDAYYCVL